MNLYQEKIVNALGHFLGLGVENAKYFFWGLEEKGGLNFNDTERYEVYLEKYNEKNNYYTLTNEEIYSRCKSCETVDKENEKNSKTLWTYKEFYRCKSGMEITKSELGCQYLPILIGNLWPFEKNKNKDEYKTHFREWVDKRDNMEKREEKVIRFLKTKAENNLVCCFGNTSTYKGLFKKYFADINFVPNEFLFNKRGVRIFYKAEALNLLIIDHPVSLMASKKTIEDFLKNYATV